MRKSERTEPFFEDDNRLVVIERRHGKVNKPYTVIIGGIEFRAATRDEGLVKAIERLEREVTLLREELK